MSPIAISVATFCKTYGIGKTKTYELIKSRELEVAKVGRKTLILVCSANALVQPHS